MISSKNNRVFIWKDFIEWKSALENMFPDILTPELEAKVKQNAESIEYWNAQMPCEELIGKTMD